MLLLLGWLLGELAVLRLLLAGGCTLLAALCLDGLRLIAIPGLNDAQLTAVQLGAGQIESFLLVAIRDCGTRGVEYGQSLASCIVIVLNLRYFTRWMMLQVRLRAWVSNDAGRNSPVAKPNPRLRPALFLNVETAMLTCVGVTPTLV